ncbi:MAG: DUF1579 domain-containing protein [Gemmataceae bacterium]
MQTAMFHKVVVRGALAAALALTLFATAGGLTAQPPAAKPGPEHEILKQCEGVWDANIRCPLGESKGTLHCKMDLNGLWLLEHFQGAIGDIKFEGRSATSYNQAKKKYVTVWIDSMSTSPMISEGDYDPSSKTLAMSGAMQTPDGKSVKATMTTVQKDADTKVFTMRHPGPDGKDVEMEITYKRKGK